MPRRYVKRNTRGWTKEQDRLLIENYPTLTAYEVLKVIAAVTGRHFQITALYDRVKKLRDFMPPKQAPKSGFIRESNYASRRMDEVTEKEERSWVEARARRLKPKANFAPGVTMAQAMGGGRIGPSNCAARVISVSFTDVMDPENVAVPEPPVRR